MSLGHDNTNSGAGARARMPNPHINNPRGAANPRVRNPVTASSQHLLIQNKHKANNRNKQGESQMKLYSCFEDSLWFSFLSLLSFLQWHNFQATAVFHKLSAAVSHCTLTVAYSMISVLGMYVYRQLIYISHWPDIKHLIGTFTKPPSIPLPRQVTCGHPPRAARGTCRPRTEAPQGGTLAATSTTTVSAPTPATGELALGFTGITACGVRRGI